VATHSPEGGLRKELGVPLYHQIQHLIRHRIHSGLYPPGTQIPSEHDLCQELAVSRVTLREALRELVRENLLIKVQGKGTFVSSNPPKRLTPVRYTGFLEELQERMRKLRVTDVEVLQTPATAELKAALKLNAATSELTLIKRLRHIDNEPFSYTLNYLPSEIRSTIWSMAPWSSRNSERWKPSGNFSRTVCSITRGPANPMSASGSAMLRSPSIAKDADTPPVVGCVITET
jgi:DNA-binding GntR family transcriptional regulator